MHCLTVSNCDLFGVELDVKKEQQLKQKIGGAAGESILISNITTGT